MLTTIESLLKQAAPVKKAEDAAKPVENGVVEGKAAEEARSSSSAEAIQKIAEKLKRVSEVIEEIVSVTEKKTRLNRTLINYHMKMHQV